MGANLQYKGLKEVLDSMEVRDKKEAIKHVNNEWKRLASFMAGRK